LDEREPEALTSARAGDFVISTDDVVFGDDDGDALTSMANLAALLWQEGERDKGFALQEQVAAALRRTRGAGDQAAGDAQAILDSMLKEAGF